MDKDRLRKDFNEFLDSATNEQLREFLAFMKKRKSAKSASPNNKSNDPLKNRLN